MPHVASCVLAQPPVHSASVGHRPPAVGGRRKSNPAHRRGRRARSQGQLRRPDRGRPAAEATPSPPRRADSWREYVNLGLLSQLFPVELVEAELAGQSLSQGRGRLPLARTVYLVLGLCVFARTSYQEVLARLWLGCSGGGEPVPNKSSLCRARLRLNWQVLAGLFRTMARPLATSVTPGAFWGGFRLMAIDGLTLDVPTSPANEQAFEGQRDKRGKRVGFAQARLVGLVECATHAFVDAALGSYAEGEQELAAQLVRSVSQGMLVLADRGFLSVTLWRAYREAGAHLLWRIRSNVARHVVKRLPDGTYIARVRPSNKQGRWAPGERPPSILVRVIEYRLDGSSELYRLATSLLDPESAPALDLAQLYERRWKFETAADELKTHQRGGGVVLRSCTPDGVRQEVWAHLLLHYGARKLMFEAAATLPGDHDPARISFTLTLNIIQRSLLLAPFIPNPAPQIEAAIAELTQPRALIHRRRRSYPRSLRHSASRYPGAAASKPKERSFPPPPLLIELVPANG